MKVNLKEESPDRVETSLGPRVYLFERGVPTEILAADWPELNRQGYVELVPEEPVIEAPPAILKEVAPDEEGKATNKKKK